MLDRAVREMKGDGSAEGPETQLNLGMNIRIPAEYISEENQRLRMYKRIAAVETESQLNDVGAELQDRYGEPPPAVRNLLDYASLKLLAIDVGATVVERKRDLMTIKFRQNATIDPEKLARFVSSHRGSQFTPDGTLKFSLKMNQPAEVLQSLQTLLADLAGAVVLPSVLS
jgi:transcription-repair coupling factor (superfamily II helicase)